MSLDKKKWINLEVKVHKAWNIQYVGTILLSLKDLHTDS